MLAAAIQGQKLFLKGVQAFGLNSGVMKWKLYGQHYVRFRQDGPVGFLASSFMCSCC